MWKKIRGYLLCVVAGAAVCGTLVYFMSKSASARLETNLANTRILLDHSSKLNTELTRDIQSLSGQLAQSNNIAAEQQRIIKQQQQTIDGQKRIIDGIIETITNASSDIGSQIQAIADGFRRLYDYYHPSSGGS